MVESKTNWWVIIAVVVVVAVISSLITISLTGNVIGVAKGTYGKVYTTSEIDNLLSKKANVLNLSIVNNGTVPVYGRSQANAVVRCPQGKTIVNGGCLLDGLNSTFFSDVRMLSFGPVFNGGNPSVDWSCSAYNYGANIGNLTAYAICG